MRELTPRDRLLTALSNEKPDRLPGSVHNWMTYYLKTYLGGCDAYQAYARFGLDAVIYRGPNLEYDDRDLANWRTETRDLGRDADGGRLSVEVIATPGGTLTTRTAANDITAWETEHLIKGPADFALFEKYAPSPVRIDWTPVMEAKNKIGDRGIVRCGAWGFGQGSPWQDLCILMGTVPAIMAAMDTPDWTHHALEVILAKRLSVFERWGKSPVDLVETGGGAGSNTVIGPKLHAEFCLPYDRRQHAVLHASGVKIVYHLCGGVMRTLDLVAENGADGLETMTPPAMGGDCDLAEARRRVGDRLFFIGGFDQNAGFEHGTPRRARELVLACHAACPTGGYLCSPSDHFFIAPPENVQAFADAVRECRYE